MNLAALQHSAFLQSLGWAIANSLWQAAVLWIAYFIVDGAYKNASARFKNNISTILLSVAFAWFSVTLLTKYISLRGLQNIEQKQIAVPENYISAATYSQWNIFLSKASALLPYLSVAYLLLLLFLSIKLVNSYRYTYFIKSTGLQKPGVEWKIFAEKVARHMGINKNIKLWISKYIDVPATIGFIKPIILIPVASVNQLSANQMEAIILHELSHIKRNDYLINLFISLIETILFFNPFIVLLSKIIKRERENCCDDFVIQYQYDRHSYASALLSLEQLRRTNFPLAISATSGKRQLLHRVKRIMQVKNNNTNFNYGQKLLALLLITGIFCSLSWLSPDNSSDKINPAKKYAGSPVKTINEQQKIKDISEKLFTDDKKDITKKTALKILSRNNIVPVPPATSALPVLINEKEIEDIVTDNKKDFSDFDKLARNNSYRSFATAVAPSFKPAPEFNNWPDNFFTKGSAVKIDLKKLIPAEVNLNKLKEELEKVNFSFSFNSDEIQEYADAYQKYAEWKLLSKENLKNLIDQQVENLKAENAYLKELRNKIDVIVKDQPKIISLPPKQPKLFGDSLRSKGIILINRHQPRLVNEKVRKLIPQEDGSFFNEKTANGFSYRYRTNEKEHGVKYRSEKEKENKSTVTVQYRNGVVIINGKKIILPDTNKLIALAKLKKGQAPAENNVADPY